MKHVEANHPIAPLSQLCCRIRKCAWDARLLVVAVCSAVLVASLDPTLSAEDPNGLAANDFGNNGETSVPASAYEPGASQRNSDEYRRENPDAAKRDYYERGGASTNHDGARRARIAYQAARYEGPTNGYEDHTSPAPSRDSPTHRDGPRPRAGGGNYADEMPTDPATIVGNIYKFVEDITYPKSQPNPFESDDDICEDIEDGTVDIGTPRTGNWEHHFMCIETIHFFTSLVRELGFPVREKNVMPSYDDGTYDVQTAACNVWYDGKWHFFDPWESFTNPVQYLHSHGHGGYGGPNAYHDVDVWVRSKHLVTADYSFTTRDDQVAGFDAGQPLHPDGWRRIRHLERNAASVSLPTSSLRLAVLDEYGRITGGTTDSVLMEIPASIYIPYDRPRQLSHEEGADAGEYDVELVTLMYPDAVSPGVFTYQLLILNPTADPEYVEVILDPLPSTVEIEVSPSIVTTTLDPGETESIEFQVTTGAPLNLPPPPVIDLHAVPSGGTVNTLVWSAVDGAMSYNVYSSPVIFESPAEPGVQFIGSTVGTEFDVNIEADHIFGVEAIGPTGLMSELDPEGGSTTVGATEIPTLGELALIIFAILLFVWMAWITVHRRRTRRSTV